MSPRVTRDDVGGRAYLDLRRLAKTERRATDEYLRLYALEGFLAPPGLVAVPDRPRAQGRRAARGIRIATTHGGPRPVRDCHVQRGRRRACPRHAIAELPHDDGLQFDTATATAESIRDEDEYAGVRVSLTATFATANLAMHADVNIGDPI